MEEALLAQLGGLAEQGIIQRKVWHYSFACTESASLKLEPNQMHINIDISRVTAC